MDAVPGLEGHFAVTGREQRLGARATGGGTPGQRAGGGFHVTRITDAGAVWDDWQSEATASGFPVHRYAKNCLELKCVRH
jgi:hypothetical protein